MAPSLSPTPPIFDTLQSMRALPPSALPQHLQDYCQENLEYDDCLCAYQHTYGFLWSYRGSQATFNAYRREVERCLQWCWFVAKKPLFSLGRADIEAFIDFCKSPPRTWIADKQHHRYMTDTQKGRMPNAAWRPFVVLNNESIHTSQKRQGYHLSPSALQASLAVLSTYFQFLLAEEVMSINPVALIRQKSKYVQRYQGVKTHRRLSKQQWRYLLETCELMATESPEKHHRTLFIMQALYGMYLRVSELAASPRWTPQMGHFHQDHHGHWWFTTLGKGNKQRNIAVSDAMLMALRRYRLSLSLSPLPYPHDTTPLIQKVKGQGAVSGTRHIRKIVQEAFDQTTQRLRQDGFVEESIQLQSATVHWLRHTGISDDIETRPREHVRDDAGHSSSSTTDRYINVDEKARSSSALDKSFTPMDE